MKDRWQEHRLLVCESCMFFKNFRCKRHAPTTEGYPVTHTKDWCGDHKLAKSKVDEIIKKEET